MRLAENGRSHSVPPALLAQPCLVQPAGQSRKQDWPSCADAVFPLGTTMLHSLTCEDARSISRYGPDMKFLEFRVSEDIVLRFIANNFDVGTAVLATDDRFKEFISLARDHKDAAAAREYGKLTNANLAECHLATRFARGFT